MSPILGHGRTEGRARIFYFVNNAPHANKRRVTSLNASTDGGLWQTRLLLWILSTVLEFQNISDTVYAQFIKYKCNYLVQPSDSSTLPQFLQNIGYVFLVQHPRYN